MKPKRRRTALLVGFLLAVALMVTAEFLNLYNARQMREAAAWIDHTHRVRTELREQYSALQELVSAARDYVTRGEQASLLAFDAASRAWPSRIEAFCRFIEDNPVQAANCSRLARLAAQRVAAAQELVDLRRHDGYDTALAASLDSPGPALMQQIRQQVTTMDAEESRLLDLRTADAAQRGKTALQLAGVTAVLSAGMLVVVFLLVWSESRLRERAQWQRDRFFELSLDLLSILDAHGRFRQVSTAFTRLLGHRREDLLGQPLSEYVHPDDRAHLLAQMQRPASDGAARELELRFRRADGGWSWLSWKTESLPGERLTYAAARDITHSRAALDELRSSEENLAVALQSIGDGILTTDAQARVTRLNRVAEQLTGWSQADALGRPVTDVMTVVEAGARTPAEIAVERAIATAAAVDLGDHRILISRDGSECSVSQSASPLRDAQGHVVGAVLVFRNVTEASRLADALRTSEAWNRSIVESSPDWISLLDPDGRMTIVTPAGRRLMEVPEGSEGEGDWLALWTAADRPAAKAALDAALGGVSSMLHGCCQTFAGTLKWWDVVVTPVQDGGGVPRRLLAAARDATGRRALDLAMREVNAFLESVIDNIPSMIFIKKADTLEFVRINRAGEALLGYSRDQLIGRIDADIFPAGQAAFFRAKDLEALADADRPIEISEESVTRSDGSVRLLHTRKLVLRDGEGQPRHLLGISEDVTEQRHAEAEIRSLNQTLIENAAVLERARAEAQAANEAKSAFLAAMSHEIRTPMNGVIGMLDVLHQTSLSGHQVEMVDLIRESAVSLLSIIDDVLDFSKIEAGRLQLEHEPMSLSEAVEKTCRLLDSLAYKQGVELTTYCDPALPPRVLGDSLRLRQVLINMVNNAIKFSQVEPPGRVQLRARLVEREERAASVEIRISDNGIGMDAATLARLFRPFSQGDVSTTRRFGGTGLGLAISSHLVTLMGGTIAVESSPGQGSVFILKLRFELPEEQPATVSDGPAISGLRVMVVGDTAFADDVASQVQHAGAVVERHLDLSTLVERSRSLDPGLVVFLIDHANAMLRVETLRAVGKAAPGVDVRFVAIGRGRRRAPIEFAPGMVGIDADVLDRRTLFQSIAMAAGLESAAVQAPVEGRRVVRPVPSRSVARSRDRLCLVAEDNETNRKVVLQQLALFGVLADVAEDGAAALELWRSGDYALILTDLHMPRMDGYELARRIRAEERPPRRTPIVALSANALHDEAQRCRAAGIDDYLSKPARLEDLEAVLARWLPAPTGSPAALLDAPDARDARAGAVDGSLAPVELHRLSELVGGDAAMTSELVRQFRLDSSTTVEELRQAVDRGDAQGASHAAHKLRSASLALGAMRLGQCCARLEAEVPPGRTAMVRLLADELIAEHARVAAYLATLAAAAD